MRKRRLCEAFCAVSDIMVKSKAAGNIRFFDERKRRREMKKKIFALIAVMTLAFVMCACGSEDSTPSVRAHEPTDDEQKIVSLLTTAQADVALIDYVATEDSNCATIGYDLYEKGKLTKKNQECLTGGIGPDTNSGMIGLSLGRENGFAAIYTDDGATCAATTDTPWKDDGDKYDGEVSAQLTGAVDVELDKKIYIFSHLANKKSEIEGATPDDIQNDSSVLKSIDKAYVYYVIFKHSKEYEQ